MPNRFNAKCRHHIPKTKCTVRNWAGYDAALRARGSLTLWVSDEAMNHWAAFLRSAPGGQCFYSDLAIETILTQQDVDDPSQVEPLLDQIGQEIGQVTADGAYDGEPTYDVIAQPDPMIDVVIPPRVAAQPSTQFETSPSKRDTPLRLIQSLGRLDWQEATGYGKRALVETTMGRYKSVIGPRLRARHWLGQQAEAANAVAVLNRMLAAGRPKSVRTSAIAA